MSIWSNDMTTFLWESVSILDQLALTIVMKNLVCVDKLRAVLQEIYSGDDRLDKLILDLEVSWKVSLHKGFELIF